jgi:hypothetical protein
VPVASHNTLRSPKNTAPPVLPSKSGGVGEGFVASDYQPVFFLIKKTYISLNNNNKKDREKGRRRRKRRRRGGEIKYIQL